MTQSIQNPADLKQRLAEWLRQVESLVDQLAGWSKAEGWAVERSSNAVREKKFGNFEVPNLLIHVGEDAEIEVAPVGPDAITGSGRVVVRAFPTFSRVKLLGGPEWTIMTDSNVPLRLPWTRETYAQLVRDLLA